MELKLWATGETRDFSHLKRFGLHCHCNTVCRLTNTGQKIMSQLHLSDGLFRILFDCRIRLWKLDQTDFAVSVLKWQLQEILNLDQLWWEKAFLKLYFEPALPFYLKIWLLLSSWTLVTLPLSIKGGKKNSFVFP